MPPSSSMRSISETPRRHTPRPQYLSIKHHNRLNMPGMCPNQRLGAGTVQPDQKACVSFSKAGEAAFHLALEAVNLS